MNTINIKDFINIMSQQKINIIDIRDKYQFNVGHINGAINIPSNYLLVNPFKYLNKNNKYFLYCQSGSSSKMVVDELNYLGYNTVNIKGGYDNYLLNK